MGDSGRMGACSTSTMVVFGKEFEDLHDDDFDGSLNEHQIFTEVLFGNDSSASSRRCLVTGVINFESDHVKRTDPLFGSNSESSALTSQAESYNLVGESIGAEKPEVGYLLEGLTMSTRSDHVVNSSPMKLSVEDLSDAKPYIGKDLDTSSSSKGVVSCTSQQPSDFGCQVTCRLVESSNRRVTSSCYLLKHNTKMDRVCELGEKDVPKYRSSNLDGNERKEMVGSKAIASPVSQESHVTKLLVNPSITATNKLGTPRPAKPKWKESCFVELDEAELSMIRDSKNDPRPLLRYHVHQLLRAAGWVVGRRKRPNKFIGEYVFKSPEGRPIREFRRAWISCGEQLLFYANNVVQTDDCKLWTDMTQFLSDLSSTLSEIEEQLGNMEPTVALVHTWCLLDPFANVVFIDKTVRLLKKGKAVKAKRTLAINSHAASDANKHISSFVPNDTLAVSGEDPGTSKDQSQERKLMIFGPSRRGINKHIECIGPPNSVSGADANDRKNSANKASIPDTNSLPACRSRNGSCGQSGIYLFEVPISSGNAQASLEGFETVSPHQDCNTSYNKVNSEEEGVVFDRHSKKVCVDSNCPKDGFGDIRSPNMGVRDVPMVLDNISKGKSHKKSKRISMIRLTSLYEQNKFGLSTSQDGGMHDINSEGIQQMAPYASQHRSNLKQKRNGIYQESASKKSKTCRLKDDDLLISAIVKNKAFKSTRRQSTCKSKPLRKRKSQKGSCRLLLRSLNKGGKQFFESKWSAFRSRTVLSWLIHSGVVSLNEVIQYRNPKDYCVEKDGLITWEGILCKCCNKLLSVSVFKSHSGFRANRPCLNLFMESGKPLTLCQLEAWSAEYKARKGAPQTVQVEEVDQNDDSCGRCGDGGELICCDNCPSTFHQACLYAQELPEGSWYCPQCTCRICGNVVNDKEDSEPPRTLKCLQCEYKYHEACVKEKAIKSGMASDTWFCSESCQEIYSGLYSRIGLVNILPDGHSWTLLRCIHGDQKVHSAQRFVALKAECNSKLAVALTIMEECFLPMVDPRTGIDMIPHVVYNWGSQFARLNYHGFYTVVLEKDDILTCVASIRIHGVTVAEMPLIATCSKYRRQGMCRRLMNAIEEMLTSLKVEKLVISAIPSLVETWTVGFGFTPLEGDEKRELRDINLMVFPGTVWLKKPLYDNKDAVPTEKEACSRGTNAEPRELTDQNTSVEESRHSECENLQLSEGQCRSTLDLQLVKPFSEEPHLSSEEMKPVCENSQLAEDQCGISSDTRLLKLSCDEPHSTTEETNPECGNLQVSEGQGGSSLDNQLSGLSRGEPHFSSEENKPKCENLLGSAGQVCSGLGSQPLNLFSSEEQDLPLEKNEDELGCHLESIELYDEKKFCLDEGSHSLCIAKE